jgi:hypothetical protein
MNTLISLHGSVGFASHFLPFAMSSNRRRLSARMYASPHQPKRHRPACRTQAFLSETNAQDYPNLPCDVCVRRFHASRYEENPLHFIFSFMKLSEVARVYLEQTFELARSFAKPTHPPWRDWTYMEYVHYAVASVKQYTLMMRATLEPAMEAQSDVESIEQRSVSLYSALAEVNADHFPPSEEQRSSSISGCCDDEEEDSEEESLAESSSGGETG